MKNMVLRDAVASSASIERKDDNIQRFCNNTFCTSVNIAEKENCKVQWLHILDFMLICVILESVIIYPIRQSSKHKMCWHHTSVKVNMFTVTYMLH